MSLAVKSGLDRWESLNWASMRWYSFSNLAMLHRIKRRRSIVKSLTILGFQDNLNVFDFGGYALGSHLVAHHTQSRFADLYRIIEVKCFAMYRWFCFLILLCILHCTGRVVNIVSPYFIILCFPPKITSCSAKFTWEKRDVSPLVGVKSADDGNCNGTWLTILVLASASFCLSDGPDVLSPLSIDEALGEFRGALCQNFRV